MTQSNELRFIDFRKIFLAVGECCELWDNPTAWRQHAVESACRIVGARTAHLIEVNASPGPNPDLKPRLLAEYGFEEDRPHLVASLEQPFEAITPNAGRLMAQVLRNGSASAARPSLASDQEWERFSGYQQYRRPARCDEFAISLRLAPASSRSGIKLSLFGIDRAPGERPATDRERQILSLLHTELKSRIGTVLATEAHFSRQHLSPREHQTLDALLQGDSEKQIAASFSLSTATVHQYVTRLYRHFDVNSRGELMAYFVQRKPRLRDAGTLPA